VDGRVSDGSVQSWLLFGNFPAVWLLFGVNNCLWSSDAVGFFVLEKYLKIFYFFTENANIFVTL
jgi:hypothetical protein